MDLVGTYPISHIIPQMPISIYFLTRDLKFNIMNPRLFGFLQPYLIPTNRTCRPTQEAIGKTLRPTQHQYSFPTESPPSSCRFCIAHFSSSWHLLGEVFTHLHQEVTQYVKKYQLPLYNCSKHRLKMLRIHFIPFIYLILIYTSAKAGACKC